MAKAQDQLAEAYSQISDKTESCANVEQLQALGQEAWRQVTPLLHGGDSSQWGPFDALFHDATNRIAVATNRPAVNRVWHHCHYLAPTPVLGSVVHVRLPNVKKVFAAHVVGVLQPAGTIEIALIRGGHDQGINPFWEPVTHASHPQHDTKQLTRWEYMPGVEPQESDWAVAKADIIKREQVHINALAQEEEHRKRQLAEQRKAKKEELATV